MPILFVGGTALWLFVLIFVAAYTRTRAPGRHDRLGGDVAKFAVVVLLGLASPVVTEILGFIWLARAQNHVDATANLFVAVVAPVVAIVVAVQAFALSRVYRGRPGVLAATYLGAYAIAYALLMDTMFNPMGDIVRYAATIFVVGALIMMLFARFAWRKP